MSLSLKQSERVSYLARVISVAGADAEIRPGELRALRGVMLRIGATTADLRTALDWHRDGRIVPPERDLSTRRQNLQDMVMVAMADNDLDPAEIEPIEAVARSLQYTQMDMDLLVKRAESELRDVLRVVTDEDEISGLFTSDDMVQPPPLPAVAARPVGPTSAGQVESVEAKQAGAPASVATRPDIVPEEQPSAVSAAPEDIEARAEPCEAPAVGDATAEDMRTREDLVLECAACRSTAEEGDGYCFSLDSDQANIWGCRLLNMPWSPGARWLTMGSFESNGAFRFDRSQITRAVEFAMEPVRACPYFDGERAVMAAGELPTVASLAGRWKIRHAPGDPSGQSVEYTDFVHGCAVRRSAWASGVDPIGARQAAKLVRRILNTCSSAC